MRFSFRGQRWIRTTEVERQQIYSLPHLATLEFAQTPFGSFASAKVVFFLKTANTICIILQIVPPLFLFLAKLLG